MRKRYGENNVVQGIDFDIQAGECVGLLRPNGAGKTTTLRMLLGLTPLTSGALVVILDQGNIRRQSKRINCPPWLHLAVLGLYTLMFSYLTVVFARRKMIK